MRTIIIAAILALTALACSNQESPEHVTQVPIQKAEPTRASAPTITPTEPADTPAHLPQPTETPVPLRIQKAEPQPLETGAAAPADATSENTTITLTGELAGMTITNDDNFPAIPQESLEQLAGSISVLAEAPEPVSRLRHPHQPILPSQRQHRTSPGDHLSHQPIAVQLRIPPGPNPDQTVPAQGTEELTPLG